MKMIDSRKESHSLGGDSLSLESVDAQMISLMRFILALSGLIIIYIDPSELDRFVAVTYAALVVYTARPKLGERGSPPGSPARFQRACQVLMPVAKDLKRKRRSMISARAISICGSDDSSNLVTSCWWWLRF